MTPLGGDRRPASSDGWDGFLWPLRAIGLTLFDAAATAVWLHLDVAFEANPLLRRVIDVAGVAPAMVLRAIIGIWLVLVLTALVPVSPLAKRALPTLTIVLGAVAGWHILGAGIIMF